MHLKLKSKEKFFKEKDYMKLEYIYIYHELFSGQKVEVLEKVGHI